MSSGKRRKGGLGKGAKNAKVRPSDDPGPDDGQSGKPARPPQPPADRAEAATGDTNETVAASSGIPVIGLGGSAGALDCFKAFFQAMPPDSGAAFVVIQHLAPTHESLLPELLAQHTRMKVTQVEDGAPVEPNCVYVIPPNRDLGIRDGVMYLAKPVTERGIRMPIDSFFRSLAEDRQERAVCVLLSGTGSDGTSGVRAIRGAGGLTIAQDPQTAQYGDMPRSAIATKLVDYVLPPGQMPHAITEYLRQPYVRGGEPAAVLEAEGKPGGLLDILAIVQGHTGCDFRCYKKSTILRRIERRMGLHRITDMAEYCKLLGQDADEVTQLFKDLLINVTAFFRDADAFEELRRSAIAPMIQAKKTDEPLRVWVPGCSSGEEAYSLAMLLTEEMTAARKTFALQVFATDIDDEALEFARQGIYPESIVADVGPERLARFFVRKEHGCQVSETLRNCVVFASQNLIADPPFSKLDLISCRNLLIYLDAETQTKLVPLFNFAITGGGYLFLGKSEGVGGQTDLFSPVSKKAKLFRRCDPGRTIILDTPIVPGRKAVPRVGLPAIKPPAVSYADAIHQALLGHISAGVVLVDRKGQILQFHGQTVQYLNMPTGEPSLNLLDIAKEGLSLRLRSALHAAIDTGKPVVLDGVPITSAAGSPCARVSVRPLARRGEAEPLLAVIFEDVLRPAAAGAEAVQATGSETVIRQLEDELRATQQDLQSSIEELQAANEELRVSNEEVVSTNEELQSTNEELETSKEELQSINEELTTVNTQLQEKVEGLDVANKDIANLLTSTQIATLFMDGQLRIKLFTPPTTRVLKLIASDMGRPISDLAASFLDYDLPADVRKVAGGAPAIERDVRHADGSIYHMRIMPYLAEGDRGEGVVVTFDDVTHVRHGEERTRRLATVVTDSNDAVVLFDLKGGIQAWNRGAQAVYGWSEEEALRMNVRDLVPPEKTAAFDDEARRLAAGEAIAALETNRRTKDGRVLDVWLTMTAVLDESKKVAAIASTERDITERKRAEDSLARAADELARSNKELEQFAYIASHDLQEPLRMVSGFLKLLEERYKAELDDKAKEYIGYSVDRATRMSQLIADLLSYSRVDRKGAKLESVDTNRPLAAALANLRTSIQEAGATVTRDKLPSVVGDTSQLTQLLQNLIGNAVKFRHADRPCQVHVSAKRQEGQWVFAVRDNGIGIPPEQFERVFVIFQRLHTRDKYAGTGIGLAICKKIVERHGGRIWVESTPGEGSTFRFTMPA